MTNPWFESYKAAILETDWTTMQERLQTAEVAIDERLRVLSDLGGSSEERQALDGALRGIGQLRTDVNKWQTSFKLRAD